MCMSEHGVVRDRGMYRFIVYALLDCLQARRSTRTRSWHRYTATHAGLRLAPQRSALALASCAASVPDHSRPQGTPSSELVGARVSADCPRCFPPQNVLARCGGSSLLILSLAPACIYRRATAPHRDAGERARTVRVLATGPSVVSLRGRLHATCLRLHARSWLAARTRRKHQCVSHKATWSVTHVEAICRRERHALRRWPRHRTRVLHTDPREDACRGMKLACLSAAS